MSFALTIGWRHLRSKKRSSASATAFVSVVGVALGVGALLLVMAISSGFQEQFRAKIVGVNSHVIVRKYGLDFTEYREVVDRIAHMPDVAGASPFIIREMMIAKGDRLQGVIVKGVDPELMPTVLDLDDYIVAGQWRGLRLPGAHPAADIDEGAGERAPRHESSSSSSSSEPSSQPPQDLDQYLLGLSTPDGGVVERADAGAPAVAPLGPEPEPGPGQPIEVVVPTPEQAEQAMREAGDPVLPDEDAEARMVQQSEEHVRQTPIAELPGIVVGVGLARNLGLGVGDRVQIVSPLSALDATFWRAGGGAPRLREFRVIGIFQAGFQEYDKGLVCIDLYEAQRLFGQGDSVMGVEIRLHDLERAPEVARRILRILDGPYGAVDWRELNHTVFEALEIQKIALTFVIATIILVAAFNVIATLIMVVLEKKREVAILKAMGARDASVLAIFMMQGSVVGLIGTALGLVLGAGACAYLARYPFPLDTRVYLIDHLPVRASVLEVVLTAVIALAICVLATLVPSWWAARLRPAEAVRYE